MKAFFVKYDFQIHDPEEIFGTTFWVEIIFWIYWSAVILPKFIIWVSIVMFLTILVSTQKSMVSYQLFYYFHFEEF